MRVLIVSHNVISETNNMGKTLLSYFQDFSPDEVAEFYIQDKEPKNAAVCRSFYRVTDREALRSVFGLRVGRSYQLTESTPETVLEAKGAVEAIRQYGRKKSASVFLLRNSIWGLAHWNTKRFRQWLADFDPEVLFYLAGDYAFMNDIALTIQRLVNKPMIVCWVDDYFFYNVNEGSALGRALHRAYLKSVDRVTARADCILTISDSQGAAYEKLLHKPCHTLHTNAVRRAARTDSDGTRLAYFGNLDFKRYETLSQMGQAVRALGLDWIDAVDVYSAEKNPENLQGLTEENGIRFRGEISPAEVGERMAECLAIIHTESFNETTQKMVQYSVSTKIADALLNGPCLIAYGPEGIASIDYLKAHRAAYVITRPEDLQAGLREVLTNAALRQEILRNARALAARNHDATIYPKKVRGWLQEAIDHWESGA